MFLFSMIFINNYKSLILLYLILWDYVNFSSSLTIKDLNHTTAKDLSTFITNTDLYDMIITENPFTSTVDVVDKKTLSDSVAMSTKTNQNSTDSHNNDISNRLTQSENTNINVKLISDNRTFKEDISNFTGCKVNLGQLENCNHIISETLNHLSVIHEEAKIMVGNEALTTSIADGNGSTVPDETANLSSGLQATSHIINNNNDNIDDVTELVLGTSAMSTRDNNDSLTSSLIQEKFTPAGHKNKHSLSFAVDTDVTTVRSHVLQNKRMTTENMTVNQNNDYIKHTENTFKHSILNNNLAGIVKGNGLSDNVSNNFDRTGMSNKFQGDFRIFRNHSLPSQWFMAENISISHEHELLNLTDEMIAQSNNTGLLEIIIGPLDGEDSQEDNGKSDSINGEDSQEVNGKSESNNGEDSEEVKEKSESNNSEDSQEVNGLDFSDGTGVSFNRTSIWDPTVVESDRHCISIIFEGEINQEVAILTYECLQTTKKLGALRKCLMEDERLVKFSQKTIYVEPLHSPNCQTKKAPKRLVNICFTRIAKNHEVVERFFMCSVPTRRIFTESTPSEELLDFGKKYCPQLDQSHKYIAYTGKACMLSEMKKSNSLYKNINLSVWFYLGEFEMYKVLFDI